MLLSEITVPKVADTIPKQMILKGGYYLELKSVKPLKIIYVLKRLMEDEVLGEFTVSKMNMQSITGKNETEVLYQIHLQKGFPQLDLQWEERSAWMPLDPSTFKAEPIRQFINSVLEKHDLLDL